MADKNQIRVCMFSMGWLFGKQTGGIRRFIELYHALTAHGYAVDLYCADEAEVLKSNGIHSGITIRSNEKKKSFLNIPSLNVLRDNRQIANEIKRQDYKWVIVFDVQSAITPCIYGVPHIQLFFRQDMIEYRRRSYMDRGMKPMKIGLLLALGRVAESICIQKAERMVSQCKCDADNLKKRHPFLRRKLERDMVIQINNINPSWVVNAGAAGMDTQKQYDIVFLGNFQDSRKGHGLLLEALDRLAAQGHLFTTAILGDGKQLDAYREKYANLHKVHFLGRISNPAGIIKSGRLMLVPSYSDSCPNTVLEALYYGVPVLGSNASGVPEILNDPAWRFELSVEDLSNKIMAAFEGDSLERLLEDQQKRRRELTFDWGSRVIEIMECHPQ